MVKKSAALFAAILGLSTLFCLCSARAGQYAVVLGEERVNAGSEVIFTLVFLQSTPGEQADFPAELVCQLTTEEEQTRGIFAKQLQGKSFREDASVKTYYKQQYAFRLPADAKGRVILKLIAVDVPALVLHADSQQVPAKIVSEKSYATLDSLFTLYQPYTKNASAYEPMYFLVGTEPEKSKFQISFKYRFIDNDSAIAHRFPWLSGMHFGYTQTSFWDLESDSAPFADTSYKPELFWLSKNYLTPSDGLFKGLFFQGGLQHESNGSGGELSRSSNYLYARPIFVFYSGKSTIGLQIAPKFWAYVRNDDNTNPDLMDYRGFFEIEAKGGLADGLVLGSTLRWAAEGASIQLDASYPLHRFFNGALDVYLYAQYTNVLAESLLDYQERSQAFRLGLAIVR